MSNRRWRRKGSLASIGVTQMAEVMRANKESVVTASLLFYIAAYLLIGIGGITFQAQPIVGYVQLHSGSNANCVAGAVWVQGGELHWCGDANSEYKVVDEAGDHVTTGAATSPIGALWVQGENLHFIGADSVEYIIAGDQFESTASTPGAIWLENAPGRIHYIDSQGDEHTICGALDYYGNCVDDNG